MSAPRGNKNAAGPHVMSGKYSKGWYSKNRLYRKSMLGNRLRTMKNTYARMGRELTPADWGYGWDRRGRKTRIYVPSK